MSNPSRSSQLRKGRYSSTSHIYLVTTRTLHREPIFSDWRLGRLVARELNRVQEQGLVSSLAWVVMPDHWHWLVELCSGALSDVVRRVKSKSAIAVNKATSRRGRLWQDGFHDKAVRREEDLVRFARYIVANPVRAGLANSVRDYPLWDAIWV